MRLSLTRYLMAVLCMLAAGTWILPVRTLAAAVPVATNASAEEMPAVAELIDLLGSLRLAGAFDRPAFTVESIDLTGDGVADTIEVTPPRQLTVPGALRVLDGVTGMERYALNPPDGERGFGDHSAVVADCDGDGAPEIAAWSWLDAAGDPSGLLIEMRLRVFSGADGTLLGLLSTVQELGVPDLTPEFDLTLAADANLDGAINASDIAAASTSLAADAALAPAVDCNTDGTLTMSDLAMVIERVIDEPQAQRVGIYSMAFRNLGIVAPIAPPGSGVDPSQMGGEPACELGWTGNDYCGAQLFILGTHLAELIWKVTRCTGTGPVFWACALMQTCLFLSVIGQVIAFVDRCLSRNCLPDWAVTTGWVMAVLGRLCQLGISSLSQSEKDALESILRQLLGGPANKPMPFFGI